MVPRESNTDDIDVTIEQNYLLAGVRGQPPAIKGRLYGSVDTTTSGWQLESRLLRSSARERTTSSLSTVSTHSSFAFVSDPDISSSFAASLESGQASEVDEPQSPGVSSPVSVSSDDPEISRLRVHRAYRSLGASRSQSPAQPLHSATASSYVSSLESLPTSHTGRLLTIHLDKASTSAFIWPSLIVGPVPVSLSPADVRSVVYENSHEMEHQYNMDATSLALVALELYDIRKVKEEAFEYFIRAWHQSRVPSATIRLVRHYFPPKLNYETLSISSTPAKGTPAYHFKCVGGNEGLAELYLDAGMLYLEGAASSALLRSSSNLSSIRISEDEPGDLGAWIRDRESASRLFERARVLNPELDIPILSSSGDRAASPGGLQLQMPGLELDYSAQPSSACSSSASVDKTIGPSILKKRGRRERVGVANKSELAIFNENNKEAANAIDDSWLLYVPGLVGAGTALLVVGVVGVLSLSTWRKNQAA